MGGAKKPKKGPRVRVRMYRVGFGDFFLITVPTRKGERHVLVDCGVHAGDIHTIGAAVDDMAEVTGHHLSLIVVTHRHADHISGFATCADRFREFTVDRVWMSAWDDPDETKPAAAFQSKLVALAGQLQARLQLRAAAEPAAKQALSMASNLTGELLAAAGSPTGLRGNTAALAMLRGTPKSEIFRFKNEPERSYYKAGDHADLPRDLAAAGLVAQILGPPTDPDVVARMDNAARQYLRMTDDSVDAPPIKPFGDRWKASADAYPADVLRPFASGAEVAAAIRSVRRDAVLGAAKKADEAVNNQSLVVHFAIGGKTMLFVGDAQWGNWSNFLFGRAVSGKQAVPLRPESKALMAGLDFYKVGHHGSTNSTPIDAVEHLREGCVAMCSTEPGCYGKEKNHSEVPRKPLLAALEKRTLGRLVRSDQVAAGKAPVTTGLVAAKFPEGFSTPGELFIDYTF